MDENRKDNSRNWKKVYLNALYAVPELDLIIHPLQENRQLDAFLKRNNIQTWAFITAENPGSKLFSEGENKKRTQKLRQWLVDYGYNFYEGKGSDTDHKWPGERSFFILDIPQTKAVNIGFDFGQNAILFGRFGEKARLVWCR